MDGISCGGTKKLALYKLTPAERQPYGAKGVGTIDGVGTEYGSAATVRTISTRPSARASGFSSRNPRAAIFLSIVTNPNPVDP